MKATMAALGIGAFLAGATIASSYAQPRHSQSPTFDASDALAAQPPCPGAQLVGWTAVGGTLFQPDAYDLRYRCPHEHITHAIIVSNDANAP